MSSLAGVTAPSSEQACVLSSLFPPHPFRAVYPPFNLSQEWGAGQGGKEIGGVGWGGGGQYVDGDIFSDDLGMDSSRSQSLAVLMLSETLPVAEGL